MPPEAPPTQPPTGPLRCLPSSARCHISRPPCRGRGAWWRLVADAWPATPQACACPCVRVPPRCPRRLFLCLGLRSELVCMRVGHPSALPSRCARALRRSSFTLPTGCWTRLLTRVRGRGALRPLHAALAIFKAQQQQPSVSRRPDQWLYAHVDIRRSALPVPLTACRHRGHFTLPQASCVVVIGQPCVSQTAGRATISLHRCEEAMGSKTAFGAAARIPCTSRSDARCLMPRRATFDTSTRAPR